MKNLDHDVFISYSSKNKNIADAIVADLEQNNVKCWYAPRDILSGEDWAGAINNAISSTKIFVLVFTDESNRSHQVTNEVTLAVNGGKIIIPFRLSGSNMNDTLQYYLSSVHWLDAVSQPLSHNIETLRKQIIALLDIDETAGSMAAAAGISSAGAAAGSRGAQPSGQNGNSGGSSMKTGIVIGFAVAALAIGVGAFALSGGGKKSKDAEPEASAVEQAAEKPAAEEVKQEEEKAEAPAAEPAAEAEAAEPVAETEAAGQDTAANAAEPAPAEQAAEPEAPAADQPASEPEPAAQEEPLVMIPENALSYRGHHYYIYNDVKTNWETAASNCRDRGGYMAVINDEEENETLTKISIHIYVSGTDETQTKKRGCRIFLSDQTEPLEPPLRALSEQAKPEPIPIDQTEPLEPPLRALSEQVKPEPIPSDQTEPLEPPLRALSEQVKPEPLPIDQTEPLEPPLRALSEQVKPEPIPSDQTEPLEGALLEQVKPEPLPTDQTKPLEPPLRAPS